MKLVQNQRCFRTPDTVQCETLIERDSSCALTKKWLFSHKTKDTALSTQVTHELQSPRARAWPTPRPARTKHTVAMTYLCQTPHPTGAAGAQNRARLTCPGL